MSTRKVSFSINMVPSSRPPSVKKCTGIPLARCTETGKESALSRGGVWYLAILE
jgi:hypothetical protein